MRLRIKDRRARGFSLVTTAACATVMFGMLGLALDLGRMYIVRTELQGFSDSSAIAATFELDGSQAGIDRAKAKAISGPGTTPNRWNFGTTNFASGQVATAFSATYNGAGGWETTPATPANMNFVRVRVHADVPVYALRILGVGSSHRITTTSFAGLAQTPIGANSDPFSPDAIDPADPDYGYIADDPDDGDPPYEYAFQWAPDGQRKCEMDTEGKKKCKVPVNRAENDEYAEENKWCTGDYGARYEAAKGSDRGYINIGQGNGTSALRDAIISRNYNPANLADLSIGSMIDTVNGDRNGIPDVVDARIAQDTDQRDVPFRLYNGNGRRLLQVPINNPANNQIIGYATFFMPLNACGTGNQDPCCAEFVESTFTLGGKYKPVDPQGNGQNFIYSVRLFNGGY